MTDTPAHHLLSGQSAVEPGAPVRRLRRGIACGCLVFLLAGCAARAPVMPPPPATPSHPEFRYPSVPKGTDAGQATRIERGWRHLQSDDLRVAAREFQAALTLQPSFHPAETGLGYVQLAARAAGEAVTRFDRALTVDAAYAPALVGRGQALLVLGRDGEALASFEAAVKADPSLADLQSRIEALRLRALQEGLSRARAAADAGRLLEARAAYEQAIAASPDSAFLYRELGLIERQAGEQAAALDRFRRAVGLDPSDARSHAQIGAILEEQDDSAGALEAYGRARSIDPAEVPVERLDRLRELLAAARLPAEYRAIPSAPTATRADVAATFGVRLETLLARTRPRQTVVTDVRGHWAEPWILTVVRAGVMDTLPNYTFLPGTRVRRGELAHAVARVLALIAVEKPAAAKVWQSARLKIADVAPDHLSHPAVSLAVAAGVLRLDGSSAFQLLRPVSGAEVVEAVGRLEALARP